MNVYNYYISKDFLNHKLDLSSIIDTIIDEQLPLEHIVIKGDLCEIYTQINLTDEQKELLDYIVNNHTGLENNKTIVEKVKIQEEEINGTQGLFQSYLVDMELKTIGTSYKDITFPFNISLFSAQWIVNTNQIGDTAEFQLAPDTVVGIITSSVDINNNIISVNDTVIENIKIGYWVKIENEDLGRILSINKLNKTIIVENKTTTSHNINSYVKITVKLVPYFRFTAPGTCTIGESKIGAAFIPANTTMRLVYNNNYPSSNKYFGILIDYLY